MDRPEAQLTQGEAYRRMALIRQFEQQTLELGSEGVIAGSIHTCHGQEAVAVGAVAALEAVDRVLCTYRGHGWALACGVPPEALLGELCQKAGGVNGGRGGSAHLFAPQWGMLGENSIVGAGVPIAAGVAMAAQHQRSGRVTLTAIGDGAMNQGAVHEALVFAAARSLPLIVLIENNEWAEMTRSSSLLRIDDLVERAAGYGIEAHKVDGFDPLAVHAAVQQAASVARSGGGPVMLEVKTVRLAGHYNRDIEHYRSKAEREAAQASDPLARLRARLIESGELTADALDAVDAEVADVIRVTTQAVHEMPAPEEATALDHRYAAGPVGARATAPSDATGEEMTYIKAVQAALHDELRERDDVLVYGEDVGVGGGIFGASRGLQEEFGADRVFDTPIAEAAILGSAVGAAMEGMRPVVEIMWADFLLVALDQLVNQAANVRYVSRGELSAPMVVRTQQGVAPGSCAQHSQSLEALLAHIPGLKVGLAATPADAYGMLRAAIADPDPVIVIEARSQYQVKGWVDRAAPIAPVGGARLHRTGTDAVVVTWGAMVPTAIEAADVLARDGVSCAVIDLRWLNPLDDETIEQAVRDSTGRVLVVHEANLTGGFGAEVVARIQARDFDYLDHPVVRLGVPDSRIPSAPALQRALVPGVEDVVASVNALIGREPVALAS